MGDVQQVAENGADFVSVDSYEFNPLVMEVASSGHRGQECLGGTSEVIEKDEMKA